SGGCVVHAQGGRIRADHVVVATLLPFLDRGGHFARAYANRSYAITARVTGERPAAMLISAMSPLRSIRSVPFRGEELLMVGGEGHHLGSAKAVPERYEKLAEFAREHWDVVSFEHRWSAQDYSPDDGVPYIGRLNIRSKRIHVATGFKKWGMTAGTLAGMLISDAIAERDNEWAGLFSATRVRPVAEAAKFLTENARVGIRMVGDRILAPGRRSIVDLANGEGGIVSSNGQKVAGYRDDQGRLHAVSSRCTHLGCQVAWNAAERSWDCPCHGSRFTPDGEILNGPATKPLPPRPTADSS
ncbi:MAG TPA: FAD-dependent oxidoreductase, partial [Jiangellaceae bacterium]|nr:FAD-dependent oxidoreductase [Jiangellaceae bacterium]